MALNPSDTLDIGLNGLAITGSSPVSNEDAEGRKNSTSIKVKYTSSTKILSEEHESKAYFEKTPNRLEIAFENKEVMNEWIDVIWSQYELFLDHHA